MTNAQAIFLAHSLSFCIAFQLICEYRHWKNKKARKRANANGLKKNQSLVVYHSLVVKITDLFSKCEGVRSMLNRVLTPTCKCGQAIEIPKGQKESRCPVEGCGMTWEREVDGYWARGLNTLLFTPIFPRLRASKVKTREEKYANYPKAKARKRR